MRIHVVSHSHWDREWYESFASHRMKLVELFDDLIELFDTDPEFKSFHLDGQTIVLDDYLEIRPERAEKIRQLIRQGKLIIGPFYILQDELLLTGEENVRNTLVAQQYRSEWGDLCKVGYFPDTFGHIGQLAQLCRQMGLRYAFFGRGVKPIGFDNQVLGDDFSSPYSEMYLESPDGSRILGILFANWYCNGNEIPTEEAAAKAYWDQRIAAASRFASTDSLLLMNGCDHQPVQRDLTAALRLARQLYPQHEFIHSSLEAYAREVEAKLPADLQVIRGEMTSQETDGWFTLANTASSRIYLKEANARIADKLTMQVEPLLQGMEMTKNEEGRFFGSLHYAWKQLLQNLTHDGICGCSIDAVHREMMVRFEHAETTADALVDEALERIMRRKGIAPLRSTTAPDSATAVMLFNPAPNAVSGSWDHTVALEKYYFSDFAMRPDALFAQLEADGACEYSLADSEGLTAVATFIGHRFGYDLSKDGFRRPYIGRWYQITVAGRIEAQTAVSLVARAISTEAGKDGGSERFVSAAQHRFLREDPHMIQPLTYENEFFRLAVTEQGLSYTDHLNRLSTDQLLIFEDSGDIGNEYVYRAPQGDKPIQARLISAREVLDEKGLHRWRLGWELLIPTAADECFEKEKHSLIEFPGRRGGRGREFSLLPIEAELSMSQHSAAISLQLRFDNRQKNHRLRLLVSTLRDTQRHFADSSYELVERPNTVSTQWQNPSNPQHMLKLVGAEDQRGGILVSGVGLQEYEPYPDRLAVTLLRSTDELGDWGDFPTEDSIEAGISVRTVVIESYTAERRLSCIKERLMTGVTPLCRVTQQVPTRTVYPLSDSALPQHPAIFYTADKPGQQRSTVIQPASSIAAADQIPLSGTRTVRYVNLGKTAVDFIAMKDSQWTDVLERPCVNVGAIAPMEIRTEVRKRC